MAGEFQYNPLTSHKYFDIYVTMYRWKNEINQWWFRGGLRLSLLAILLLMTSPLVDAVHHAKSGHQYNSFANGSSVTGHEACCHESDLFRFLQKGEHQVISKHSSSGMGHDPLHCSVCQSLRVLGTPFAFLTPPSMPLPTDAERILLSTPDDSLLSHFPHSSQSRAPPFV